MENLKRKTINENQKEELNNDVFYGITGRGE